MGCVIKPLADAFLRIGTGGNIDLVSHRLKICVDIGIVLPDVFSGALTGASDAFPRGTDWKGVIVFLVPCPFDIVALQAGDDLIHFDVKR